MLNTNFSFLMSYYLTLLSSMIPITALVTFSSVERAMVIYLCCYTHTYTSISKFFLAQASAFGLVLNCLFFYFMPNSKRSCLILDDKNTFLNLYNSVLKIHILYSLTSLKIILLPSKRLNLLHIYSRAHG